MVVVVRLLHEVDPCPKEEEKERSQSIEKPKRNQQSTNPDEGIPVVHAISRKWLEPVDPDKREGIVRCDKGTFDPAGSDRAKTLGCHNEAKANPEYDKGCIVHGRGQIVMKACEHLRNYFRSTRNSNKKIRESKIEFPLLNQYDMKRIMFSILYDLRFKRFAIDFIKIR